MNRTQLDVRRSRRASSKNSASASVPQMTPGQSSPERSRGSERVSRLERWLAQRMLATMNNPPVTLEFWNGEQVSGSSTPSQLLVRVHDRKTFWELIRDPLYQFGEAYSDGRLEVNGDLVTLIRVLNENLTAVDYQERSSLGLSKYFRKRNTLSASRKNIHHHYDIGNDFYKLWLDQDMVYTCAYFPTPTWTLEQAQVAKMEYVCRKLRIQPGDTVIEAGCGWGGLALYLARQHGATVRAYNISHEQVAYARERAKQEGLADRVEFIEEDWRQITGSCDVFVSVGMLEHVGLANFRQLGNVIDSCLKPDGRGLIHSIGFNRPRSLNAWIEQHIFPGAQPPGLREMMDILEPKYFSVLDVENLRLHYAETLKHWLDRFEASVGTVQSMFDERFVRMWRFYLASSISAFQCGTLQLFQVVFNRGTDNNIPWTRDHQRLAGEPFGAMGPAEA